MIWNIEMKWNKSILFPFFPLSNNNTILLYNFFRFALLSALLPALLFHYPEIIRIFYEIEYFLSGIFFNLTIFSHLLLSSRFYLYLIFLFIRLRLWYPIAICGIRCRYTRTYVNKPDSLRELMKRLISQLRAIERLELSGS